MSGRTLTNNTEASLLLLVIWFLMLNAKVSNHSEMILSVNHQLKSNIELIRLCFAVAASVVVLFVRPTSVILLVCFTLHN